MSLNILDFGLGRAREDLETTFDSEKDSKFAKKVMDP